MEYLSKDLATVGVADARGALIGTGCIAGNVRHAVFCDFVVHPDFQHKEIGSAILAKRLLIALELNNLTFINQTGEIEDFAVNIATQHIDVS